MQLGILVPFKKNYISNQSNVLIGYHETPFDHLEQLCLRLRVLKRGHSYYCKKIVKIYFYFISENHVFDISGTQYVLCT